MTKTIRLALFKLWPPYEAWWADKQIARRRAGIDDDTRWTSMVDEVRGSIPQGADLDQLEKTAKQLEDSEANRKETLESKASSFTSGIGVALTITSLVIALFVDGQVSRVWLAIIGSVYFLSIIHLLTAAYHATKARRVAAFATLSADAFVDFMKTERWKPEERIAFIIAEVKWNEGEMLRKSNSLAVAESLFFRGLSLITLAIVLIIAIRFFTVVVSTSPINSPIRP